MTRSVRIHEFGGADVLKIEDAAVREPGPGQVRLRIHAVGLKRTEVRLRSGRSPVKPSLPCSVGFEAAGAMEALGPDVSGFVVGDRVALVPAYSASQYALHGEVSLATARSMAAIPDNVSFSEAAATWVAYGTAWGGLVAIGALGAGQTVLIPRHLAVLVSPPSAGVGRTRPNHVMREGRGQSSRSCRVSRSRLDGVRRPDARSRRASEGRCVCVERRRAF
jgi:hypothetical protein